GTGKMELVPEESQLVTADGTKVDSVTAVGSTYTTRNTYIIAARKPLAKNQTYTVTMTYKIDGQKQTRTWSFTTGPLPAAGTPPGTSPAPNPSPAPSPSPSPAPKLITLPAGLSKAPAAIGDLWRKVDGPVAQGGALASDRTWLYGPDVNQ